ncbi:hypothetical protein ACEN9F_10910 [Duganella sp. CT11-25]|uniref:hypothetical protein n=1 Tax=unclassified Duganella TaxID=2636909 RepID=UPI0039AFD7BC
MKFPFARSPRQELCKSPPTPDQCGPLSVVESRKPLDVVIAAVAIKAPLSDSLFSLSFGRANPAFSDITVQRVIGDAIAQSKDHRLAFNFILRFIEMQKVIAVPEMEPWMPESTGVVAAFHPAVCKAVASLARPPVAPNDAVHGLHQADKASLAGRRTNRPSKQRSGTSRAPAGA